MKKSYVFPLALYATSALSFENPFLAPIGSYEAITGNTGIGRIGSIGSVIYNPAAISSIKSSKISASGSAFALNSVSLSDGTSEVNTKSFQAIPAQISTVFANDKFVWAFSILVPKKVSYEARADVVDSSANLTGSYVYNEEDQETYIGPSIGFKVSQRLSLGMSFFVDKLDYRYTSEQIMLENGTNNYSLQTDRRYITATTAIPLLGIHYKASDTLFFGLRFSGPNKKISGNFEHLVKTIDNTSVAQPNGKQRKNFSYTYEKPLELGIGVSSNTTKNLTLLLDVAHQFKKRYVSTQTDLFGEKEEYNFKNVQRYHFGLEYQTSHTDKLAFGLNYTPHPFEDGNLDFKGITLGYRTLENIADSSIGLFYNQANAKDQYGYKTKAEIFGLFLSTSVDLKN